MHIDLPIAVLVVLLALAAGATGAMLGLRGRLTREASARRAAEDQLRHADGLRLTGQLAAGVAHDVGTPLNVVRLQAQMISTGELADDADIVEAAESIVEECDRMTQLLRRLLDFARPRTTTAARTDLVALSRRTLLLVAALARKAGVTVVPPDDAEPVWALLEPAELQQVLLNLVVNAVQAMERGGTVQVAIARIDRAGAPWATVQVRDDGPGIPEAEHDRVFQPFYTTKDPERGTGLGLAVCRAIVTGWGGRLVLDSRPGHGATFTVWVPECGPELAAEDTQEVP